MLRAQQQQQPTGLHFQLPAAVNFGADSGNEQVWCGQAVGLLRLEDQEGVKRPACVED